MNACPLRQNEHEHDHKHRDDRRGNWTAEVETNMVYGLVEEIANSGAEWSGQNERGPEDGKCRRDTFVQK